MAQQVPPHSQPPRFISKEGPAYLQLGADHWLLLAAARLHQRLQMRCPPPRRTQCLLCGGERRLAFLRVGGALLHLELHLERGSVELQSSASRFRVLQRFGAPRDKLAQILLLINAKRPCQSR